MAAKCGITNGGRAFGMDAMSPTVSTSRRITVTATVTTTRAMSVANASSGLTSLNTAHTATVASATRHGASCHDPMWAKALMNLPMVL